MKKFLFGLCIALFSWGSYAQTICTQYHRKNCDDVGGKLMKYDSQSKSAIMAKGQVSEFHMVAYKNLDYRITICAEDHIGDQIQFKIIERIKELIKEEGGGDATYSEDSYSDSYDEYSDESSTTTKKEGPKYKIRKELLYDNANDGFVNFIEFTAEGPMSLIIEIGVPGDGGGRKLKIRETGCVGVLIEHTKSERTGF